MNQKNIDDLKSQLDQIQAALGELTADRGSASEAADDTTADSATTDDTATTKGREAAEAAASKPRPRPKPAPSTAAKTEEVEDVEDVEDSGDSGDSEDVAESEDDDADADATEAAGEGDTTPPSRLAGIAARFVPRSVLARIVVAVVVVLAIAGGTAAYFLTKSESLPKNVAYRIYGHDVSIDDINKELDTLTALYGVQPPSDSAKLAAFRRDLAKATAVSRILDRAATDRNIVIADKAAQDVLTRYIAQQFGSGGDAHANFVQALGGVGTTEAAVLNEIKRQLAISQLYNQITAGITISDAEVKAAFDKDHKALDTPELRDLRNIVVATKAQADQIRTKLLSGQAFATLAKTYSLDASTNIKGGELGKVAAADLDTAYAKAAFAAASGAVFGPVQTQYGWNVGQVVSISPPAPAVYDKIKTALKDQMLIKKQLDAWRAWLTKQIKSAHVTYSGTYRPTDPNAAPTTQPGQLSVTSGGSGSASTAPPTK